MKSRRASAGIQAMIETKNSSSRYFRPRSSGSSQRGTCQLRPKTLRPSFHSVSDAVPTGQSQPQKDFFSTTLIARKATSRNMAAGCIVGARPVSTKYLRFIRPAMGSQPSTPAGRETCQPCPPRSKKRTQSRNCAPIHTLSATKTHCTMRRRRCDSSGAARRTTVFFLLCCPATTGSATCVFMACDSQLCLERSGTGCRPQ